MLCAGNLFLPDHDSLSVLTAVVYFLTAILLLSKLRKCESDTDEIPNLQVQDASPRYVSYDLQFGIY